MNHLKSEFLITIGDTSQFTGLFQGDFLKGNREPRVAVVGRSNVGKSSLLNALLGARLARTSKQPGKTRCIHCYRWGDANRILIDLPGYGYARASHEERNRWEKFIHAYFEQDSNLEKVLLLLDSRHGPSEADIQAMQFLSLRRIPVTFVFTKMDTLKNQSERAKRHREVKQALKDLGFERDPVFWVSGQKNLGIKELVNHLKETADAE